MHPRALTPPAPPQLFAGRWIKLSWPQRFEQQLDPVPRTTTAAANPPPFSSTMTVWQRASSRRNSLSTGSLSRRAASSSAASQKSNFFSPWWFQVPLDPCKRQRKAAGV